MFYELKTFHTDFSWIAGAKHVFTLQLPFDATASGTTACMRLTPRAGSGVITVDGANVVIGAYAAGVTPVTIALTPGLSSGLKGSYDYNVQLVPAGIADDAFAICAGTVTWVNGTP